MKTYLKTGIAAFGAAFGALATAGPAFATSVLLDIDGPLGGVALLGQTNAYKTVAASFTPVQDIINASIGMHIACFDDCAGEVRLYASAPADDVPSSALQAIEGFSGTGERIPDLDLSDIITTGRAPGSLSLLAGQTYTMVMHIQSGGGAWYASSQPSFDGTFVTPGTNFISEASGNPNWIEHPFEDLTETNFQPLLYRINGDLVAAVPLPAGLPLVLISMGAFALCRRKHTAS